MDALAALETALRQRIAAARRAGDPGLEPGERPARPLYECARRTLARSGLIGARERPFAVLDFDNTCIVNDIAEAVLAHMCRNQLLRGRGLIAPETPHGDYHRQVFRR